MSPKLKDFLTFYVLQFWTYGVVCISMRTVSQAAYVESVLIDLFYGAAQWFIIKKVSRSEDTVAGFLGFTLGCVSGTAVGIKLSLLWLGK